MLSDLVRDLGSVREKLIVTSEVREAVVDSPGERETEFESSAEGDVDVERDSVTDAECCADPETELVLSVGVSFAVFVDVLEAVCEMRVAVIVFVTVREDVTVSSPVRDLLAVSFLEIDDVAVFSAETV